MEPTTKNYTTVATSNEEVYSQFRNLSDSSKPKSKQEHGQQMITVARDSIASSSATVTIEENDNDINNNNGFEEDPFLLVSLRKAVNQLIPPRPKYTNILYLFGILDLFMVMLYAIKCGTLKKYQWGLVLLCLIRFMTVIYVVSSNWIRELRWILGGVCCVSCIVL
jgi:hypothetical protein